MQYESPIFSGLKCMAKVKVFSKVGQRSKSQGQKLWYHMKGLVIRNTHIKYESSIFNGLKVIAEVKVWSTQPMPTRTPTRTSMLGL